MFNEIKSGRRTIYYFAYGSNMSRRQMRQRCPNATFAGVGLLRGWALRERLFADIDRRKGNIVHGVAWKVTERCERSLDAYEGVNSGLYERIAVNITLENGMNVPALCYQETPQSKLVRDGEAMSLSYTALCAESAIDCQIPVHKIYRNRLNQYAERMGSLDIAREAQCW